MKNLLNENQYLPYAVTAGFEPAVRLDNVRRFSKPVVSASHPRHQLWLFCPLR